MYYSPSLSDYSALTIAPSSSEVVTQSTATAAVSPAFSLTSALFNPVFESVESPNPEVLEVLFRIYSDEKENIDPRTGLLSTDVQKAKKRTTITSQVVASDDNVLRDITNAFYVEHPAPTPRVRVTSSTPSTSSSRAMAPSSSAQSTLRTGRGNITQP